MTKTTSTKSASEVKGGDHIFLWSHKWSVLASVPSNDHVRLYISRPGERGNHTVRSDSLVTTYN